MTRNGYISVAALSFKKNVNLNVIYLFLNSRSSRKTRPNIFAFIYALI